MPNTSNFGELFLPESSSTSSLLRTEVTEKSIQVSKSYGKYHWNQR
ncbi:MAG: hypothetical protein V7L22_28070 [Nostoc sp.]